MQTGDLVMFQGSSFTAWVIRTWTNSKWAHSGLLWVVDDIPLVIEAMSEGVTIRALAHRKKDKPLVVHTGKTLDINAILQHTGEDYSDLDALRAAFDLPGISRGWECAEFCAKWLGHDMSHGWTPKEIAACYGV